MPKPTFLNLPAEKRDAFIALALDEFAQHDYAAASISRLVQRAGIAKGSVYQYFEDKLDLYLFVLEHAGGVLLGEVTRQARAAQPEGFFETLRLQMSATARAAIAHPAHAQLLKRSALAPATVRDALAQRMGAVRQVHLVDMVRAGIASGELAPDLDPDFAAWFVAAVIDSVGPLVLAQAGLDASSAAAADDRAWQTPAIEGVYDRVVRMLRAGLAA